MQGRMPNPPLSWTDVVSRQRTALTWGVNERKSGSTTCLAGLALACLWVIPVTPVAAEQYRYDELGRLISTTLDDGATITYRYDAAGNRTTVTLVSGDPDNDPPIAANDARSTDEDQSVVIRPLDNDSDPQGDPLTLAGVGDPLHGTTAISGNTVVYTPELNFFGSDSFGYEISDGSLFGAATVSVSVASVNDAPTAVADAVSATEDQTRVFDPRANDTDVETDWPALQIAAATDGAKGAVAILSGGTRLRYTPNTNANGADSFTYTIRDAGDLTSTATVNMAIVAVNDPVDAVDDSYSTAEDSAIRFDPRANDADPDETDMIIAGATQGAKGLVTIVDDGARLSYRPHANANGADSFTYTVTDGPTSDTATVSMAIAAVNDPPVGVDDRFDNQPREQWLSFNVLAGDYDPDGDALTIESVGQPLAGSARVAADGARVEYIYDAPFLLDEDWFSYTISDSSGLLATASVSVTFNGGIGFPTF